MIGHPGSEIHYISTPAFSRRMLRVGDLYSATQKRIVTCPLCEKPMQQRTLRKHMISQHQSFERPPNVENLSWTQPRDLHHTQLHNLCPPKDYCQLPSSTMQWQSRDQGCYAFTLSSSGSSDNRARRTTPMMHQMWHVCTIISIHFSSCLNLMSEWYSGHCNVIFVPPYWTATGCWYQTFQYSSLVFWYSVMLPGTAQYCQYY
jgi:hypothetical protein